MGGNSDLERRIMRLEQAIPHVRQRIIKLGDLNGQLIQALSGGGVRAYNDGQPLGPTTPCGSGPSSMSATYTPDSGTATFNYYSSVDQYIGTISFTNGGAFTIFNSCGGSAGGTMNAIIAIKASDFSLASIKYTDCVPIGGIELLSNTLPSDLTSNFSANQSTNVTALSIGSSCGPPITITLSFKFGTSTNFVNTLVTVNISG